MKLVLNILLWLLLAGGAILLFAFTNKTTNQMRCKEVIININNDNENYFVDEADILQMAYQRGDSLKGQMMKDINIYSLENIFNAHPSVQNAEVYASINGELFINIIQRKPIARIITYTGDSYYFDADGKLMPLSEKYSARVPVFTGSIPYSFGANYTRDFKKENLPEDSLNMDNRLMCSIFHLAKYINESEFWTAQIEQVNIVDNDFELIPKVGDNKIIFGDAKNTDKKFKKLMTFYTEGLSKTGWNKYSIINLKYENQVLCTKNDVALVVPANTGSETKIVEPIIKDKSENKIIEAAEGLAKKVELKVEKIFAKKKTKKEKSSSKKDSKKKKNSKKK